MNLEAFRLRRCKKCQSTICTHRSRWKSSGRHYAKHGSQKPRDKR